MLLHSTSITKSLLHLLRALMAALEDPLGQSDRMEEVEEQPHSWCSTDQRPPSFCLISTSRLVCWRTPDLEELWWAEDHRCGSIELSWCACWR